MRLIQYLLPLFLFFSFSSVGVAKTEFDIDQLASLFDKYKRKEAYLYASEYLADQEGNPYFDYYYGVSAIDSGFASQGVFALERVLLAFPEDPVARLELARGYFVLEEYPRSRQEFEEVLSIEPPDSVKRTAYLYLDRIRLEEGRYKTTVSGMVELGAGYDSNVNSAPADSDFGIFTLTGDSIEKEDAYYNVVGQVKVEHPFAPGWKGNVIATGVLKQNQDLSQFDTLTANLQAGVSLKSKSSLYNLDAIGQEFQLDGEGYRQLLGLNAGWRYEISELSNFSTNLQAAQLDYDYLPILDSKLYSLNIGYTQTFTVPTSPVFYSNLKLGMEDADSDEPAAQSNTQRNIIGIRLGAAFSLSSKFVIQTVAGYQNSQYKEPNSLATNNAKREDDYVNADLNFLWLLDHKWRVDTRFSYVQNASNVDVRKYDRLLGSINVNYSF